MPATITGVPALLAKFSTLQTNGDRMAKAVVQSTADKAVLLAKTLAPEDLGGIVQGINKQQVNNGFGAEIHANAPESAYMEFGTGPLVDIPTDMAAMAAEFQGAGSGSFADFIIALTGWVKRHGLTGVYSVKTHKRTSGNTDEDEQAAYAIAISILRNGLAPRPFLYPAFVEARGTLPVDLEKAYQTLLKSQSNK